MAILPLLNISIPGILPTPTYMPGSLALLSLCMVFAALALSYNLLLGTAGMLSFGHALYFGAGAYGLGIVLENTGIHLGATLLIFAFIVTVIGGLGSLTGAAIASVLVAVLQQFANTYLGGTGDFIVVILLAVVLLARPSGILGRKA